MGENEDLADRVTEGLDWMSNGDINVREGKMSVKHGKLRTRWAEHQLRAEGWER